MEQTAYAMDLLMRLGFTINLKKSCSSPSQEMEFLGYTIKSSPPSIGLPQKKKVGIIELTLTILQKNRVSLRTLAKWLGKVQAGGLAWKWERTKLRRTQMFMIRALNIKWSLSRKGARKAFNKKRRLTPKVKAELLWWKENLLLLPPSTTERESSRDLNGNRCITVGLRSSLRGGMPTEDMDTGRKDPKDKRTRVDSCNSSSEILHRTKKKHESSDMDRQRDSDGLHKQERRNKVGCNASLCAPVLGTSTEEGAPDNSMLYKHKAKHNSGLLITNISRQKGLVSKPKGLQQDHREAGSSGSGHDGHAEQQESRALRLMAERGSSSGYRRLLTGLEQVHKGLHIPRSCDNRKGHQEAEPVYDRDHTDCTNVEEPSMVPPGSRSPNRLPKVAPNDDRPDPGSKKPEPPSTRKGGLKLGGLESLRVRMEKDGFSKEVAEMVGEKWKHSTRVTYEHSWNTWYNWCTGKLSNPVSAPITDIAQFLLDQYSQGASYNKLGVLRSALSVGVYVKWRIWL